MAIECAASIRSDNSGLPLCIDSPIPECTEKQYRNEVQTIHRANAQFTGNPLDIEEHLATDQGCKIGPHMIPHTSATMQIANAGLGLMLLMMFVAIGVTAMWAWSVLEERECTRTS